MLHRHNTAFYKPLVLTVLSIFFTMLVIFSSLHKTADFSSSAVTVFSPPRGLKPFHLSFYSKEVVPFSSQLFNNHWTLLFFGFSHCANICPTTLTLLNRVYRQLQPQHPLLQVIFVSLDPAHDHPQRLKTYMASFNKDFSAATGTEKELKKVKSLFGIFSQATSESTLAHSNSIMLVNPQGRWRAIISPEIPAQQLQNEIERLIS